ncbi:fimbrial major subunit CsuA/B family protein [Duganella sp. FT80W]|uniref:Fimbrial major subunit CsuA/B family protein n=1 Tax=Duganella guangzhouensis TaxID=2666084 RepID=A0A6I2KWD7_9BURK|nr:spore coat U domain-containing protein [Duganella guangzhouensis]MRW88714.1 fimbrial major subunit CsuA/B family protein [Duganella guangzhouensis]
MKSKSVNRILACATIAAILVPVVGGAAVYSNGTKTTTFDVTLKIIADCTISAATLDFGQSQGVLATTVNATSNLSVTCTNTTPYNIGLNAGTGAGSTIAARVMSGTGGNTSTVSYTLKQTSGGANWGTTQGTDTVSGVGTGSAVSIPVYGNIPVQTTPQPDTYKSTITATVYF